MKKNYFLILVLFALVSCGTPAAYFNSAYKPQKASAETYDGGWGVSYNRPTIKIAVFEAILRCQSFNPNARCMVKNINDSVVPPAEAQKWRSQYDAEINNYEQYAGNAYDPVNGKTFSGTFLKLKGSKKTLVEKKPSKKVTKKEQSGSGTAFFINKKGYLITNSHVVENCNSNEIFYKRKKIKVDVVAKDRYLDLALLKSNISNSDYISLENKPPQKLQRIIAAGYPFGKYISDDMKFTSGIISSLKGPGDDSTRIQIDAALNPGNSGGPIIDEETGKLIAVAVAGLRKDITEASNFGIKTSSVKSFLSSNRVSPGFSINFGKKDTAQLLESSVVYITCK